MFACVVDSRRHCVDSQTVKRTARTSPPATTKVKDTIGNLFDRMRDVLVNSSDIAYGGTAFAFRVSPGYRDELMPRPMCDSSATRKRSSR